MVIAVKTQTLKIVANDDDFIASLDRLQGLWTEEQYLRLSEVSRLIEFSKGTLEVLPMPSHKHQVILRFLLVVLDAFMQRIDGTVICAPMPMRTQEGKYREPDIMLLLNYNDARIQPNIWSGADLVVEIVSPDKPERDIVTKRLEYAEAGILEYWIVEPDSESITVLQLDGDHYSEYGVFQRGDTLTSPLLTGFDLLIDRVFKAR